MLIRLAVIIFTVVLAASAMGATQAALDQDARVIELLRKNGSDFTKLHRVDYFFLIPTEAGAKAIAAELESTGYSVLRIGIPPKQKQWEVHAQRSQFVQLEAMQATTIAFSALAKKFDGIYDGWGAPTAK
jgi:regulator of RNase E activity RraB